MAQPTNNGLLRLKCLTVDAVAVGHSVLEDDLDEARFRAHLVSVNAGMWGLVSVAAAAHDVLMALGEPGEVPKPGYGVAVLALAKALSPRSVLR
ncbi:hypothetical protein KPL74_08560 [Bacillus sp. NP157]|nr:hypothetical protein KPL74_08560 [Bacillus sp. NP157]